MNVIEQFIDDNSEQELKRTDIQFLGLNKQAWDFERGARTERLYKDDNDKVNIKDYYTYVMSTDNKDVISFERYIEWLDDNENILFSEQLSMPQSTKSIKAINREIRQGRLDYLESGAENLRTLAETLPEPLKTQYITVADNIELLFSHYDNEIRHYIERGTSEFEDAVNNETDSTILSILSIPVRQPDTDFPIGLTAKQSIIYQLTGVKP